MPRIFLYLMYATELWQRQTVDWVSWNRRFTYDTFGSSHCPCFWSCTVATIINVLMNDYDKAVQMWRRRNDKVEETHQPARTDLFGWTHGPTIATTRAIRHVAAHRTSCPRRE